MGRIRTGGHDLFDFPLDLIMGVELRMFNRLCLQQTQVIFFSGVESSLDTSGFFFSKCIPKRQNIRNLPSSFPPSHIPRQYIISFFQELLLNSGKKFYFD